MNCYIPSNFDFEKLFPDCLKYRDKYYYFIHKIIEERIFDKRYEKDSFIHLYSEVIKNIIGVRIFYKMRYNLLNKNVIEINHRYSDILHFSKGYRLTDTFSGVKHKKVNIEDEKILQRVNRYKLKLTNDIPEGSEYKFLYNNLNKINIDHLEALNFINQNYSFDPYIFNSFKISIDYINDKSFFFVVDNIAGRVHTNISNLSRELRPFLNFEGKPLINIDISNSQPFLFNTLIQNYFVKYPQHYYLHNINNLQSISPYVVHFKDIELFERLTSEGRFYEYLMKKAGIKNEDRQKFKKDFFGKVFFCNSNDKYVYKETKLFRELFPNVYKVILHYKKEDYKQLAINLQKTEANLMINKVCKRISEERPDIFVTTIHDSILTTSENKDYICNIILNEFEKNYNLKPSIKIE